MERSKLFGLLLVLVTVLCFAILAILNIQAVYEPPLLLPTLNTIFAGILSLIVSAVAAWAFVRSGSARILLMGGGMLAFGLGTLIAGWLLTGGANLTVTVHNTCALLGGILCLFSAARGLRKPEPAVTHRGIALTVTYGAVSVFVAVWSLLAAEGATPPFFVVGAGPTLLRQVVLGGATVCYALTAAILFYQYARWRSTFLYWYALALMLIAIGLFAVFVQRSVGTPLGWLGRSAQYLGCIFALVAVVAALRSAIAKGVPLETVLSSFFIEAEANYKALVETATDAIISFDQDYRVILWNSAAEQMFGYAKSAVRGTSFPDLALSPLYAGAVRAAVAATMAGSAPAPIGSVTEIEGKRADGTFFPLEFTLSAQRVPTGWVGTCILRDMTARKEAEAQIRRLNESLEARVAERTAQLSERVAEVEQLNGAMVDLLEELKVANQQATQSAEQLKAANAELETFTYSVSHDLKAPLRGIDGYSRLLLEEHGDRLDDDARTFLRNIRHASGQMGQLIDDLLTYSRLERRTLHTVQISPRTVVETVLAERFDEITRRGVSITQHIACESVTVEPEGLAQALRNLLDNALKFTRDTPCPALTIGACETATTCILWIADNGTGFDMTYHDRIFEIFQRLHRQEEYPGTGVGLAIVRKAIKRMDGRTWAESVPGQGSTFYLEVPK